MKEYIEKEKLFDCFDIKNALGGYYAISLTAINAIPAADVVEVRHGQWTKCHDELCYWLACSVCGEKIPKRFGTDYYTNYCPNCGAKMTEV